MTSSDQALIIAEAGVNHNGDLERAIQLIDAAADAGADVVKFQTFQANKLATFNAEQASYQQKASATKPTSMHGTGFRRERSISLATLCTVRGKGGGGEG